MTWQKNCRTTTMIFVILLFAMSVFAGSNGNLEKGIELFHAQEYAEAKGIFTNIFDEDSKNSEACYYLGRLCFIDHDYDKAIKWFKKAVKLDNDSSEYHFWLGNAYGEEIQRVSIIKQAFIAKKWKNAWEKAVELDADHIEARFSIMHYYLNAPAIAGGSKEKAHEQAAEIKKRDPKMGHEAYFVIYALEKKYDLAEKACRDAINFTPEDKNLYINLSNMYKEIKKYEKALSVLEEIHTKYPDDKNISLHIGWIYVDSSQFDQAFKTFEEIMQDDPTASNAYYQWGRTSIISGQRLWEADKYFIKYLDMKQFENNPPEAAAHYRLGQVYEMTGRTEQAKNEFQAVLKLDKKHKEAKEALAKLR
jgi:tetratricopeptide (TPR) repeat protein